MKIFSVEQIRNWDAYTIKNEPVKSVDLMERAATACFDWIIRNFDDSYHFIIFSGKGNNGGDGLAIARLLKSIKYRVSVYIVQSGSASADFETNLKKLEKTSVPVTFLNDADSFPQMNETDVIIDALFGTGLNKPPKGLFAEVINFINDQNTNRISIDVPSGLYIDKSSIEPDHAIVKADFTLTFQNQKLAFLLPENEPFTGEVSLLDIGLSQEYEEQESCRLNFTDENIISGIYRPRKAFSNKGNFGYASLLCGSYGMMGAAILSSLGCLRIGVGKLTVVTCEAGYPIIQTAVPEAMCMTSGEKYISDFTEFEHFDAIGIGPGIGKHDSHKKLLKELFTSFKKPIVIDADALNVLSETQELYSLIPAQSIITPHPKEFERLFGKVENDFERIDLALSKAKELNIFIVLKGHFTFIATPDGNGFFNSTGNAGMATAGAGDVLTGIITGLVAQNYSPLDTCILGVYLHGLAGDIAAESFSLEAMIAGDIIENLGAAFKKVTSEILYV
ncbi:MAG TPA: NAD(P)H-hydrate dehydratase [Hanamia sp.]|nr:NAD(P)H-hydrate dehydratase [Hanamia sp.]